MMNDSNLLPIAEDLDFHYLLTLMPALTGLKEFEWLPELYSIISDYRSLIRLCKYCGGETIKIPTLDQLTNSTDALQWYYDVYISGKKKYSDIPSDLSDLVEKIRCTINARNS